MYNMYPYPNFRQDTLVKEAQKSYTAEQPRLMADMYALHAWLHLEMCFSRFWETAKLYDR